MKNKKVLILCAILLVVLVAAAVLVMTLTSAKTEAGSKTITFEVVDKDGKSESLHPDRRGVPGRRTGGKRPCHLFRRRYVHHHQRHYR